MECLGDVVTTIRVGNVDNLREAKGFSGELVVDSNTSDTIFIGTGLLDLSTIPTLTPSELLNTVVERALIQQGV